MVKNVPIFSTDAAASESETKTESYICQYCDREFNQSDTLVRHEMQHLIGNSYEVSFIGETVSPEPSLVWKPPKG